MQYRKLWVGLTVVMAVSFAVLIYFGVEIYRKAPPIPERVVTEDGAVVFTAQEIKDGQNVWQSMGGQEVGSVWGHGAYVAPDWTADWLHREATYIVESWAQRDHGNSFEELGVESQAALKARLQQELRTNTYDETTGEITISALRAEAIAAVGNHYNALFSDDPELSQLRDDYAVRTNSLPDPQRRHQINAFFFWATWACVTNRPGQEITYTHNWPPDKLVDNRPTGSIILWSGFSVIMLIGGIGLLTWFNIQQHDKEAMEEPLKLPDSDRLANLKLTPCMHATFKFFWVATALLVVQIIMGVLSAHYGVEGSAFYGIPIDTWLPYAVVRTWHTQLGIFWIATAWLGTGLLVAPALAGEDPKFQRPLLNFLFLSLLIIVVGSMIGQWLSVMQRLGLVTGFWFGHQGYEYVDLGRFWQIYLLVGLCLWLGLMIRALAPAFRKLEASRSLLGMFLLSAAAIGLFYGAGMMWGRQTNLAIAEYWRWWVVHLWVEGFFEVFATAVVGLIFAQMGLLKISSATRAIILSSTIYLGGGILGTFHHLYFTGTPTSILALGATFSALEVVPLILVSFEAFGNWKLRKVKPWVATYKWPLAYMLAVSFWNLVGAGIFGFLINAPIALYYMQGLNTTPLHAHTALFGVYGNLGLGLMLFCMILLKKDGWNDKLMQYAFWAINGGLLLMALLSLLPVGLAQTFASVENGMWYARSPEFLQTPLLEMFRWLRVIGDTIFAVGAVMLAWYLLVPKQRRAAG